MSERLHGSEPDEQKIRQFLSRLSRDKHAVSAHFGIRLADHADYRDIPTAERQESQPQRERR